MENHVWVDNYPSDKRNSISANTYPITPLTPILGMVRLVAANTASDGSGVIATLVTGSTNGTRVDKVTFINSQATAAASSAMLGKLLISNDAGTTWKLYSEIVIATATRSTTAIGAKSVIITNGLIIPSGNLLGCIITIYASAADQTDVIAEGGNY